MIPEKDIEAVKAEVQRIKKSLQAMIEALPFVISPKDLGNNWSVEHHDFKVQYRKIAEKIEEMSIEAIPGFLRRLIETKTLVVDSHSNYRIGLHDDVVAHLVQLLQVPCAGCGSLNLTDLTHSHGDSGPNIICHDCGSHFYRSRWWTKEQWQSHVNEEA